MSSFPIIFNISRNDFPSRCGGSSISSLQNRRSAEALNSARPPARPSQWFSIFAPDVVQHACSAAELKPEIRNSKSIHFKTAAVQNPLRQRPNSSSPKSPLPAASPKDIPPLQESRMPQCGASSASDKEQQAAELGRSAVSSHRCRPPTPHPSIP
jgi:hypothetical protein